MTRDKRYQLLERELAADDPWRLNSNPFEEKRYAQMLRMSQSKEVISNALEVGCAAGSFTERLAPHCQRLMVVDVMPPAIARARQRTKRWSHITWIVADIERFWSSELFDLIVVAEVLYYLDDITEMRAAIQNLTSMLATNGRLVFGSARDDKCRRWGHPAGAETAIEIFNETLIEVERLQCLAESGEEECLLVLFHNPVRSSELSNCGD
ncbi:MULTISPECIES: nodulation methyltransferase NodS [unclassified Bradyrhizobium]|uniref:nodulation methyltransferase NodS n=1 Tax=unclassified Bradyrhizobium TaxID=2631580 RepID=UPI00093F747E|nr:MULTISPECIES: nodulation methyltransferase NodS [unclassified Bradyrhizobium]OKO73153.1 SAM-dependent methyltransferase [Bradyrhizobium sp. NAS80.1]OKO80507.1 SAM-dependent methyltransferase [Bradyrhizobium sp. AS23.2]